MPREPTGVLGQNVVFRLVGEGSFTKHALALDREFLSFPPVVMPQYSEQGLFERPNVAYSYFTVPYCTPQ
jgi:hypothetical protein